MPACDSVKAVNTPKAYSGMSLCVSAAKTTSRTDESTPRTMMPFENARRSPRKANCFGMTPSRAMTEASVGRPAKACSPPGSGSSPSRPGPRRRRRPSRRRSARSGRRPSSSPTGTMSSSRRQEGGAEEEGGEDRRHPDQRSRGVLRLRRLEVRHAVGDRLDAGQGGGSRTRRRAAAGRPSAPAPRPRSACSGGAAVQVMAERERGRGRRRACRRR